MSDLDPGTISALLRRMVLTSRDDYNEAISGVLRAAGFNRVGWSKVDGNVLTVYVGGTEEDEPEWSKQLVETLGGRVSRAYEQRDDYYLWRWVAEV